MSNKEYLIHVNSIRVDKNNHINTFRLTTTKRKVDIGLKYIPLKPKKGFLTFVYPITIKDICKKLEISLELYNKEYLKEKDYKDYVETQS